MSVRKDLKEELDILLTEDVIDEVKPPEWLVPVVAADTPNRRISLYVELNIFYQVN